MKTRILIKTSILTSFFTSFSKKNSKMKCQLFNFINLNFKLFIHTLIIFISVYVAYYPSLDAELVFDDEIAIIKNPDVKLNSSLLNLFRNDYWGTPLNSVCILVYI